jgi:alkanesulfonate monooxygenase SsuD/methylene tetrahydromethanopterin reductase-like flavin-dependent oxidoreductase (luciferase family)
MNTATTTDREHPIRIGVKPGQWGWSMQELSAAWHRAEDLGFDVLACFDHVTARPAGLAAWDAPNLLGVMAAHTQRIRLSVDVLNVALRHPYLLTAQLAVVQAASAGRLQVGLGAGSFHLARDDHQALGIPMPKINSRRGLLEICARVFPALWRGEGVTDTDLSWTDASLGPIGIAPPPIVLGGTSEAVMDMAVRLADGWNTHLQNVAEFAARVQRVNELCAKHGRTRPLLRQVQVFADELDPDGARAAVATASGLGATTVMFVFHRNKDLSAMERLVRAVN